MSAARIHGHTVRVRPQIIGSEPVYSVEGVGASGLYAECVSNGLKVVRLGEGRFYITRQTVLNEQANPQTPLRDYLCTGIRDTALGKIHLAPSLEQRPARIESRER